MFLIGWFLVAFLHWIVKWSHSSTLLFDIFWCWFSFNSFGFLYMSIPLPLSDCCLSCDCCCFVFLLTWMIMIDLDAWIVISTIGALYLTPPRDPSIHFTFGTMVLHLSMTCYLLTSSNLLKANRLPLLWLAVAFLVVFAVNSFCYRVGCVKSEIFKLA